MNQNEFEEMLRTLIEDVLEGEELKILKNRYGLDCPSLSIKKAEKVLGISASKIRTIEKNALNKIINSNEYNKIKDDLFSLNLNEFMTNGISGYYLLAIQIIR